MKILAVKLRALGDTVLWTSALEALRSMFPQSDINLMVPEPYRDLFKWDPRFPHVFSNLNELKGQKFEKVLNFHANPDSRKISKAVQSDSVLIHHHSRKPNLYGSDIPIFELGKVNSAIQRDLNVLRTLGWRGESPKTLIHVPDSFRNEVRERRLLLGVFATRPAKQWPFEYYEQLAGQLSENFKVVLAYANPQDLENYFVKQMAKKISVVHTPRLVDLMKCVAGCHYYVGTDSGLKHLSVGLGLKTLTLFGPESVGEWHPYPEHAYIQREMVCRNRDPEPAKFSWCGEYRCPLASHGCLASIGPKEVYNHMKAWLD